jgi:hypothetical protein
LAPYAFIYSARYGLFADFDESLQRETFADFIMNGASGSVAAERPKLRRTA